jgi:two-component system sensor histidine kinase/response regulator
MDCQMPGLDGLAAARIIRTRESGARHTTIVAVTASAAAGEIEACLAAGMDACLTKPFSTVQLSGALARVLQPDPVVEPYPLDGSALERQRADLADEGVLARIAGLYVDGLREARESLAAALEADDAAGVRRVAHKLRSSSATFGASRLARLCSELESLAATGGGTGVATFVGEIDRESQRVAEALAARLGQSVSSR